MKKLITHNNILIAQEARKRAFAEKLAEERRTGLRECRNCGPLPLADFFSYRRMTLCKECIDERDSLPEVQPIRPYQPKLKMEDFPVDDSLAILTKRFQRAGTGRTHWKAA
jgi:hypothetical protein